MKIKTFFRWILDSIFLSEPASFLWCSYKKELYHRLKQNIWTLTKISGDYRINAISNDGVLKIEYWKDVKKIFLLNPKTDDILCSYEYSFIEFYNPLNRIMNPLIEEKTKGLINWSNFYYNIRD